MCRKTTDVSLRFTVLSLVLVLSFVLDVFLEMRFISVFGMHVTAGVFVFPLVYIADDCLTEVYGYRRARLVMWLTFAANALAVGLLQLSCLLPAQGGGVDSGAYVSVFSASPRIFAASMLSLITGSTINAAVLSRMKVLSRGRHFRLRAVLSSVFGRSGEVLVFYFIAYTGALPAGELFLVAFHTWLLGIVYEACVLPVTERVARYLKRAEGVDTFDYNVSYNPFSLRV